MTPRLPSLALLLATFACSEPTEQIWFGEVGDPCRPELSICQDDNEILVCEDNTFTKRTCDEVCAALGPAYVATGCDSADCLCVPADPNACTPGETACTGPDTIDLCDETQAWASYDCNDVCANIGLAGQGCAPASETEPESEAACACTAAGTPCEVDAIDTCVDEQFLATCVDGLWAYEDCAAACAGAGSCDPFAAPHACACM